MSNIDEFQYDDSESDASEGSDCSAFNGAVELNVDACRKAIESLPPDDPRFLVLKTFLEGVMKERLPDSEKYDDKAARLIMTDKDADRFLDQKRNLEYLMAMGESEDRHSIPSGITEEISRTLSGLDNKKSE